MKKNKSLLKKISIVFVLILALVSVIFAFSKFSNLNYKNPNIKEYAVQEKSQEAEITLGCTGDILIHSPILAS